MQSTAAFVRVGSAAAGVELEDLVTAIHFLASEVDRLGGNALQNPCISRLPPLSHGTLSNGLHLMIRNGSAPISNSTPAPISKSPAAVSPIDPAVAPPAPEPEKNEKQGEISPVKPQHKQSTSSHPSTSVPSLSLRSGATPVVPPHAPLWNDRLFSAHPILPVDREPMSPLTRYGVNDEWLESLCRGLVPGEASVYVARIEEISQCAVQHELSAKQRDGLQEMLHAGIMFAVGTRRLDALQQLLSVPMVDLSTATTKGIRIDDPHCSNILVSYYFAVREQFAEGINCLLEKGLPLRKIVFPNPLMLSIEQGNCEITKQLLHGGASTVAIPHTIKVKVSDLWNPIGYAVRSQNRELVQSLLDLGLSPNLPATNFISVDEGNERIRFPSNILIAVLDGAGDPEIVRMLLQCGAKITCYLDRDPSDPICLRIARRNGFHEAEKCIFEELQNRLSIPGYTHVSASCARDPHLSPPSEIDTFHDFVVLGSVDVVTNRFFGTTSTQAIFLDATDNSLFTCFDQYIPFEISDFTLNSHTPVLKENPAAFSQAVIYLDDASITWKGNLEGRVKCTIKTRQKCRDVRGYRRKLKEKLTFKTRDPRYILSDACFVVSHLYNATRLNP